MMNPADWLYNFKNMNLPAVISAARITYMPRSIGFRYICSKTLQCDKYSSCYKYQEMLLGALRFKELLKKTLWWTIP